MTCIKYKYKVLKYKAYVYPLRIAAWTWPAVYCILYTVYSTPCALPRGHDQPGALRCVGGKTYTLYFTLSTYTWGHCDAWAWRAWGTTTRVGVTSLGRHAGRVAGVEIAVGHHDARGRDA